MSPELLAAAVLLVLAGLLITVCIRADAHDQAAYDRWYADPRRPWNPEETE